MIIKKKKSEEGEKRSNVGMAQFKQPGPDRFPSRNTHDSDQLGGAAAAAGSAASRIHLHHHHHKPAAVRLRRHKRGCVLPAAALILLLLLLVALSASIFLVFPSRGRTPCIPSFFDLYLSHKNISVTQFSFGCRDS